MDTEASRTWLVTGGAGFIGSCWGRLALEAGESVVVLDKLTYASDRSSLPSDSRVQFFQGDICDEDLVAELLERFQPSGILHFAAESHVDRSIEGPGPFVQSNVVGTCTLLDCSLRYWEELSQNQKDAFRFLHVSTDEVYGSLGPTGKFDEHCKFEPNSPYSASKAAADHFVRAYHQTFGLPVLSTHCCNNFGPFQNPEKLIPRMIMQAMRGEHLPVFGDGQNVRDWLYVEDHCRALNAVVKSGVVGETYCVGAEEEQNNLDLVHMVCELLDELAADLPRRPCAELIEFVPDRLGHDRRYAIDPGKITSQLGWRPQADFRTALRKTVQWYLDNQDWVKRMETRAAELKG